MEPIDFEGRNGALDAAPGTDEFVSRLPTFRDGNVVVSCWKFTKEELAEINRTGSMFISTMSGISAPPILPTIFNPVVNHPSGFCLLNYVFKGQVADQEIQVFNRTRRAPPYQLAYMGNIYTLVSWDSNRNNEYKFYLRLPTPTEMQQRFEKICSTIPADMPPQQKEQYMHNVAFFCKNQLALYEIADDTSELLWV